MPSIGISFYTHILNERTNVVATIQPNQYISNLKAKKKNERIKTHFTKWISFEMRLWCIAQFKCERGDDRNGCPNETKHLIAASHSINWCIQNTHSTRTVWIQQICVFILIIIIFRFIRLAFLFEIDKGIEMDGRSHVWLHSKHSIFNTLFVFNVNC